MFDPFGDFETHGYLRNVERLRDLDEVKVQEHVFFEAHLEEAMTALQRRRGPLTDKDFLQVHGILFGEFYPWAGKDRHALGVGRFVSKGQRVHFEESGSCQRAVEWGLSMGNDPAQMRRRPGYVMGAFAFGHPFLDGNGRTMLLVHAELCHRAVPFVRTATTSGDLLAHLKELPGLNGQAGVPDQNIAYRDDDPEAIQAYRDIKRSRGGL